MNSLDNMLTVLETISLHPSGISLTDIVNETNIPKTSVHRIISTLKSREYIEMTLNETYNIGIKALEIGIKGLLTTDVVKVSIPFLRDLSNKTGETAFLGVYNNAEIVYLYKHEGTKAVRTSSKLGSRRPAYCTALGRAILANLSLEEIKRNLQRQLKKYTSKTTINPSEIKKILSDVYEKGYACENQEMEEGLSCIASPIFNHMGKVIAAVSVAGPAERITNDKDTIISELLQITEKISQRLGYFGQKLC